MKKIYYLLLICLFMFLPSIVLADEVNVGYTTDYTNLILTNDRGVDITLSSGVVNTTNLDIKSVIIYVEHSIDNDTEYILELSIPNATFTNVNEFSVIGYNRPNNFTCNVIQFDNSNSSYPKIHFKCPSLTSEYFTITLSNTFGNNITTGYDFRWNYTYLRYLTGTNDDNTQDIIDNQNQNTQDIIDNQNQNTQDIIDAQKSCSIVDKSNVVQTNKILGVDGSILNANDYGITDYVNIYKGTLYRKVVAGTNQNARYCFYGVNKDLISCHSNYNLPVGDMTIPTNAYYARFSIQLSINQPQFEVCKDGNQGINDSINDLDSTIKDDDIGDSTQDAADFILDFDTNTFGLTSIVTAPLNLIQSLTSSTCVDLELPLPYLNNKKLTLPCMTNIYSQYFGSFFTLYQTITYGIIAYWIIVRIFNQVKDFKNPEHDEIEVVDL